MLFTLEAVTAQFGDALLLHYGTQQSPKVILIDGGPSGVYLDSLKPRLEELRDGGQLTLQMVMVSHIDRDHITGVLALVRELVKKKEQNQPLPYKILRLWHNSFDDLINNNEVHALGAALDAAVKPVDAGGDLFDLPVNRDTAVILADVPQGRDLRNEAKKLALQVNAPFQKLVAAPATGRKDVSLGDGLKFTVVGPNQTRLEALQDEWNRVLEKLKLAKDAQAAEAIGASFADQSIPNLSSIVVLAEAGGKRMLLTGDARGDDILAGLRSAGLLGQGRIHLDLLKLPHHGSDRNVATSFFRAVTADHYVVSGDGTHGNPDIPTLVMLSNARGQDEFTIHLTNREDRLVNFFEEERQKGKRYKAVFRDENELSVRVDLGDPL
jgi:beta-lactamase superfamily II metal-dependent hydrolase